MKSSPWVIPILLAGFALRLYNITAMSLRADEAVNLYLSLRPLGEIAHTLASEDAHAPLYYFIIHYWLPVSGQSELALRFPNVASGVLIVALACRLIWGTSGGKIKFIVPVGLAAAVSPSLIWDAQDAYMYALFGAATLSSLCLFLEFRRKPPRLLLWLLYVAASAAAFYLHYFALFAQIGQGVVWLYWMATRQTTRAASLALVAAQVCIALLLTPWLAFTSTFLANYTASLDPAASWLEMLSRSFILFSVGRADARTMPPMVEMGIAGWLALVCVGLAVMGVRALRTRAGSAVLIYMLGALGAYFAFSDLRFPVFDERRVIYLTPVFLALVGAGAASLKPRIAVVLAMLFVIAASGHSLYNYWQLPEYAKSPDWRGFAERIVLESQPGDVLIQNYPDPALPYYLQNRIPRVLLPRSSTQNASDVNTDLVRLTTKYQRAWFQPAPGSTWDTEGLVAQWFEQNAHQITEYEFNGARLELYVPLPNPGANP